MSMKCYDLSFSHIRDQGQPKVTILTILVVLEYSMLNIRFQGNCFFGSGEKDFVIWLQFFK